MAPFKWMRNRHEAKGGDLPCVINDWDHSSPLGAIHSRMSSVKWNVLPGLVVSTPLWEGFKQ